MKSYVKALQNYSNFEGRARRSEFWLFLFIHLLILITLWYLASDASSNIAMILLQLYILGSLIPSTAVTVRRLHDVNANGWWLLLMLVPLIGWTGLLYLLSRRSYGKDNRYGATKVQYVG